ncbi:hydroxymethylpyrimidine pyrophosphatase-like HAD family hydrolase [Modestobacter roseus]|uniref:Hydroxymethylpyrimidine pyrophosphatase-like HAD family hydrolase n=2 Tax=Modestobacter roseus TaxID=1181884 RepID=A0A562IRN2_9ACTN|nr:hypothetical protein [Modestobacter roseus]TWH73699.1 hydroxymethylpyrimidine pyrophosphatase-like HAD family hydrolase [Modestobacter roseus]
MTTSAPPLGLLLDVDGPIASPATRTVAAPGLVADLRTLLAAGVPVVFNTGRSDAFLRDQVVPPLLAGGLPRGARLHAVCEKGAVWTSIGPDGMGPVHVDEALAVPLAVHEVVDELLSRYRDTMFLDGTKRSMASVEARTDVPAADYTRAQAAFDAELVAALTGRGLGVGYRDRQHPDDAGAVPWRVDPSVIATDVESADVGKDLGARRALTLLSADGPLPRAWHTVGDSRSDYRMADQLHALGHRVTHVDVRPAGPLPTTPYPVLTDPVRVDDAAGAAHLRALVVELRLG